MPIITIIFISIATSIITTIMYRYGLHLSQRYKIWSLIRKDPFYNKLKKINFKGVQKEALDEVIEAALDPYNDNQIQVHIINIEILDVEYNVYAYSTHKSSTHSSQRKPFIEFKCRKGIIRKARFGLMKD